VSEWQEVKLGTLVESVSETFKFNEKPVVFLNTSDILADKFLHKDLSEPKTLPGQAKKRIKKGDLLFSEIRPANKRYALVNFDADNYVVSTKLMVLRSKGNIDPTFLKLFLTSEDTLDYLQMIAEDRSGTFPQITFDILGHMELMVPPLEEQKTIASVLSSLDDKIDLLHRQNTILERMAETLFRQWYVEEAQDSNIGQFIDLQNGYAFKSQDFKDIGEQRVLKIKNISGGIIDVNNTNFIDSFIANKTDNKFKVVTGDILFAMTGAEIGKLGIVPKTNTPLWLNQRVGLLKEKYKGARFLAYLQLNSDIGQDYIENSATGSAQPNISGSLIEQCPFPKVEISKIKECSEILDVYYQKLISNLGQIQTLGNLRNNLLPKLMNGDVKVN
jgi:type I restriction enzyme, S subunit